MACFEISLSWLEPRYSHGVKARLGHIIGDINQITGMCTKEEKPSGQPTQACKEKIF